jgi:hypothetical protein
MVMRLLILAAAAAALPATAASAPAINAPAADMPVFKVGPSADDERCPPISRYHVARREQQRRGLKAQKLTELPVADAYLAVSRQIDGCEAPIIVRYGIGGG